MNYLAFLGILVVLFVILKLISLPMKVIGRIIVNSIIGGIILYLLAKVGIFVTITWWSILLTGIFGIPGAIISAILLFIL